MSDMEIEVFVHDALCMAYSGRCLLSGYINKHDPNKGTYTNSCRWKYDVHAAKETETGDVIAEPDEGGTTRHPFAQNQVKTKLAPN